MNNYFPQCPALMSDGRHFTNWRQASEFNEYIKYINELERDDDYRLFLQNNAEVIMENEWKNTTNKMKCWENACIHKYPTRSFPHHFKKELTDFNKYFELNQPKNFSKCNEYADYRLTPTVDLANEDSRCP
jgi:hypothetical protein